MRHRDPGKLEVVQPVARWTGDIDIVIVTCHTFCDREKKRGDDYEEIKQAIGHKMIEQTCKLYPQVIVDLDKTVSFSETEYFRLLTRSRLRRSPRR